MPFYLQMSKNITQQRDVYDTVIFRFFQNLYGLTMKRKVQNYIQQDQLKKIKRTKSRFKREIKCYKIKAKKFPMYK